MGLSKQFCFGGHGFEFTSLFWWDVGLSPHLCFGDVGLTLQLCFFGCCGFQSTFFLGEGVVGLSPFSGVGWWWFYFDFSGVFKIFWGGLGLKFINICSTFTHSFTQFLLCTVGKCKCWTVCFFGFWAIKQ